MNTYSLMLSLRLIVSLRPIVHAARSTPALAGRLPALVRLSDVLWTI